MPTIYTIGFVGNTKDQFMEILNAVGVRVLIDIRLWRTARFVPWASGANLAAALGDQYRYMPELVPTKELLTDYKTSAIDWPEYEKIFNELLAARRAEKLFDTATLDGMCFLCSERTADKCHRRLAVEYLAMHFSNLQIVHL